MRINHKILSIPPYVSTSWRNISSLHVENKNSILVLAVTLSNEKTIEIPNLEGQIIEEIFSAHAKYLENEQHTKSFPDPKTPTFSSGEESKIAQFAFPVPFNAGGLENFGGILQHNPEQASSPDLPPEILNKIASISKTMGIDDPNLIPKAEPHCNCVFCQLSRAIHSAFDIHEESNENSKSSEEELVSDEDLKFRNWDITKEADKLYIVKNPLDEKESYHVFLGDSIGCTCGEKNCEHVRAVLYS